MKTKAKPLEKSRLVADSYELFLRKKHQFVGSDQYSKPDLPEFLFPFQRTLTEWALKKGRAAIFADCGLGKTPISLVWASNVAKKTGKPVLILTPLAVAHQFVAEGEKFGIFVRHCKSREVGKPISVTNYEKLHHFSPSDWGGVVCDESSILKNFSGKTRKAITEFLRTIPYRLLCTATAAPNDYIEFGTSAEALRNAIWTCFRFFKHDTGGSPIMECFPRHWRFRGHAGGFLAPPPHCRLDLGLTNSILPPLRLHTCRDRPNATGWSLFDLPVPMGTARKAAPCASVA
jgi:hypothetical protein